MWRTMWTIHSTLLLLWHRSMLDSLDFWWVAFCASYIYDSGNLAISVQGMWGHWCVKYMVSLKTAVEFKRLCFSIAYHSFPIFSVEWIGKLFHSHQSKELETTRHDHQKNSSARRQPTDGPFQLCVVSKLHVRIRSLAIIFYNDTMYTSIPLRCRRHVPNDDVGHWQTQKLQKRIQRLSKETKSNSTIHHLSCKK